MKSRLLKVIAIISFILFFSIVQFFNLAAEQLAPQDYFGFQPGADRQLFNYDQLIGYLEQLAGQNDRLELRAIGETPLGRTMYLAFISSARNIKNLDTLKLINKNLALNPNLSVAERNRLVEKGRVFCLLTLSMHSTEVGPSQACPTTAYQLATTQDPQLTEWLDKVVLMIVPCHNPDGMEMVVDHYQEYKDTPYEGSSLPGVYHKYVGHDNNRDFVILSQQDTKAIAQIYNQEWFPQVMVEKHQMGSGSVRYFVPPSHDPIAVNVDAELWTWVGLFGSNLISDMTQQGLAGVSQHYLFDDYWPGATATSLWKNVISLLTECASVQYATPIYVEPTELKGYGKGLSEYKKSVNMPMPWPGGWWRLSDIVTYERTSTFSLLKTAALYRKEILTFRNQICQKEVEKGLTQPPYYYILPRDQYDQSELVNLINLLREHGIQIFVLQQDFMLAQHPLEEGDIVIPLAQPFRSFIKEAMEAQEYPVRHYSPQGKIIKPYDITSWSLPLHRGLTCWEIDQRSSALEELLLPINDTFHLKEEKQEKYSALLFPVNNNESYQAAFRAVELGIKVARTTSQITLNHQRYPEGCFIIHHSTWKSGKIKQFLEELEVSPVLLKEIPEIQTEDFEIPEIGLVETYFHDMDAGWTRFILDNYHIPYNVIHPHEMTELELSNKFDVIIFPDTRKSVLMQGKYKYNGAIHLSNYPPDYTQGMGQAGLSNLLQFIIQGGRIIAWGRSTRLFNGILSYQTDDDETIEFELPYEDISEKLHKAGLYSPGALIRLNLVKKNALTLGLESPLNVFCKGRPVFSTSIPYFDTDRRVIGVVPEKDIFVSGYEEHIEKLANKALLIWVKKSGGQLVLFGFNPQFRGSTQGTYKLLFNAILLDELK